MTAPIRITPEYELYRVVTDYEALHEGFVDRIEEINVPRREIDEAGGFTPGYASKLLCDPPIKIFGKDSLGKMLKATGMALVLVVDDERFAPIKAQLVKRRRSVPPIAGKHQPAWLFKRKKAREMGKKRFSLMTDSERKRHQRKAAKARAKSLTPERLSEIASKASKARWALARAAVAGGTV